MNSLELFNQIYKNQLTPSFEKSLLTFFRDVVLSRINRDHFINILDLGCGSKSIFEEINLERTNIMAIDFSSSAINLARQHSQSKEIIKYEVMDLEHDLLPVNSFDLVFDSHCLHCIKGLGSREKVWNNLYQSLKQGGILAAEMMVQAIGAEVRFPHKHIPNARDLELEIIKKGFKIIYYAIERSRHFANGVETCDLVRVLALK